MPEAPSVREVLQMIAEVRPLALAAVREMAQSDDPREAAAACRILLKHELSPMARWRARVLLEQAEARYKKGSG